MTPSFLVKLQAQRHKRVQFGHPWIFSNEVVMDVATKAIPPGSVVSFAAHNGAILGVGTFNPHTLIAGRVFSRQAIVSLDSEWFTTRIRQAVSLREKLGIEPFYRLIHAEADGMPGIIIDRFGACLGVQLNTAGAELLWPQIKAALLEELNPQAIVLHNESSSRALEGLSRETRIDHGDLSGPVEIRENGIVYFADLAGGQKTGWYFDQRDNHALMARYAKDKSFLDLYSHAGGFGILAAVAGASRVVGVDSSQPALALAGKASAHNNVSAKTEWVCSDVFEYLQKTGEKRALFDVVVADPPPFVKSKKDVASGSRGYRKLARLAGAVTVRGGLLYIASCSHNMTLEAFTTEVVRGLSEAHREGQILYTTFAAPDHPVHPYLPESSYLKALVLRIL